MIHLGDYIYEYANATYGDGTPDGRIAAPNKEMVALADYRERHAQYKADPDAREVDRQHPFIVVWDDHELTNNAWREGAENHNPDQGEGDWFVRRDAAVRAFFEWMPIREDAQALSPRIYRSLRFGDLADLMLLDTRLVGRDEQRSRGDVLEIEAPERSLLGLAQEHWLHGELWESKRSRLRWQILGQQVMFAPQTEPGNPANNPDSWEGYRAARDRVFDMIEQLKIDSLAVLTGDVHSNWVFDLPRRPFDGFDQATGRGSLGIEFAGTSVTSPSPVGAGVDGEQAADRPSRRAAPPALCRRSSPGILRPRSIACSLAGGLLRCEDDRAADERRGIPEGIRRARRADACHRTGLTRDTQGVGSGSGALIPCGSASSGV